MNGARHDTEDLAPLAESSPGRPPADRRQLEPRNISIAAQAPHLVRGETFAGCGLAALLIQDAGDDLVGVMRGEAGQDAIGLRPVRIPRGFERGNGRSRRGERPASPTERELRAVFGS